MKAALYIRVSTIEQAMKGYSLPAQEEMLRKYADYKGYEVVGLFCDDGYSGKDLNRPEISRLIEKVRLKEVDIVIVYRMDRISRRVKDVIDLVDLFIETGVQLFSLNDNVDMATPMGRAMLKVAATFSELERETIIERTTMGKNQRALSGLKMANGKNPFGYIANKEKKRFEIVSEEAEIVKDIFAKYIDGLSVRELNDYCAERYHHPYFNNAMSCKEILHRMMYAGYYIYNGEVVKGINFDPIIDLETFYKVQAEMELRQTKRATKNTPYLLTGLVFCAKCGNSYYGKRRKSTHKSSEKTYRTYGCGTKLKPERHSTLKCDNLQYSADWLENHVINTLLTLNFTKWKIPQSNHDPIEVYIQQNIELKKQKEKLLDLYLDDALDKKSYSDRISKLDQKIEKNSQTIASISKAPPTDNTSIKRVKELLKDWDTLNDYQRHKLLERLIEKIIIDDKQILIKFKVK